MNYRVIDNKVKAEVKYIRFKDVPSGTIFRFVFRDGDGSLYIKAGNSYCISLHDGSITTTTACPILDEIIEVYTGEVIFEAGKFVTDIRDLKDCLL